MVKYLHELFLTNFKIMLLFYFIINYSYQANLMQLQENIFILLVF
jgi:hypothetical protein